MLESHPSGAVQQEVGYLGPEIRRDLDSKQIWESAHYVLPEAVEWEEGHNWTLADINNVKIFFWRQYLREGTGKVDCFQKRLRRNNQRRRRTQREFEQRMSEKRVSNVQTGGRAQYCQLLQRNPLPLKNRSIHWICQLVLLGDLNESISGRRGGRGN